MNVALYKEVLEYLAKLIKGTKYEGHVYAVGGCVRDSLIAKAEGNEGKIKDIDLVVDLPKGGIEFAQFLHDGKKVKGNLVIYETFGTVMFKLKKYPDLELEAVQTRSECYRDEDSRNPETSFGTIQQDAFRRDFTINALYYDISGKKIIDFNGHGLDDLRNHVIDTCGDPDIIFNEDPLRIMRAVRFAARLGYSISDRTVEGIKKYAERLCIISQERITDEFNKIIVTSNPAYGITKLQDFGIMKIIAPILCKSLDVRALHTITDVSYYTDCYNLYALIADKPQRDKKKMMLATISYFTGYERFELLMHDMKYSNDEIKEVRFYASSLTDLKYASENRDLVLLHKVEYECGDEETYATLFFLSRYFKDIRYWEAAHPASEHPFIGYRLPVDGQWVMDKFNISPGPNVGYILKALLHCAFAEPEDYMTREDIERRLKTLKTKFLPWTE